jgi:phospholipase C
VHRFFQMWQQVAKGKRDLFVWVAETAGTGNHTSGDAADDTAQGALAMGFYNMHTSDAPFFKEMARHYVIGDNYHQAIMGGTGANNLPNPVQHNSYRPSNGPAIGDLMNAFDFHHFRKNAPFITVSGEHKHHDD